MVTQGVEAEFELEPSVLDEILVDRFDVDGTQFRTSHPVRFELLYQDTSDGPLYLIEGEFNVMLASHDRAEVLEMLGEELPWLWTDYAMADPAELAPDAQQLRRDLRNRFVEVSDAS